MTNIKEKDCEHKKQNITITCSGSWNECRKCGCRLSPDIYKAEEK